MNKKKSKLPKNAEAVAMDEREQDYRDLMADELFNQWSINEHIMESILDQTMGIIRDKEINVKVPLFSLVSTMETIKNAIEMKEIRPDSRKDDIFIDAADGEEIPPPPVDSIGRERQLNSSRVIANKAKDRVESALVSIHSKLSSMGLGNVLGSMRAPSYPSLHSSPANSRMTMHHPNNKDLASSAVGDGERHVASP